MFVLFLQLKLRMIKAMPKIPINKQILNNKNISKKEFVYRKGVGEHKLKNITYDGDKFNTFFDRELLKKKDILLHNHIFKYNKKINGYKSLLIIPSLFDVVELLKNSINKNINSGVISVIKKEPDNSVHEIGRTHFQIINSKLKLLLVKEFSEHKKIDFMRIRDDIDHDILDLCKRKFSEKEFKIVEDFFKNSEKVKVPKLEKEHINKKLPLIFLEVFEKYGLKVRFVANKKDGYYFDSKKLEFLKKK